MSFTTQASLSCHLSSTTLLLLLIVQLRSSLHPWQSLTDDYHNVCILLQYVLYLTYVMLRHIERQNLKLTVNINTYWWGYILTSTYHCCYVFRLFFSVWQMQHMLSWYNCCNSVRLSVYLSVRSYVCHTRALWRNENTHCQHFDTIWKVNHSTLLTPTVVASGLPCQLKLALKVTHPLEKRRLWQIFAHNVSTVRAIETRSVITNGKSTGFSNEL